MKTEANSTENNTTFDILKRSKDEEQYDNVNPDNHTQTLKSIFTKELLERDRQNAIQINPSLAEALNNKEFHQQTITINPDMFVDATYENRLGSFSLMESVPEEKVKEFQKSGQTFIFPGNKIEELKNLNFTKIYGDKLGSELEKKEQSLRSSYNARVKSKLGSKMFGILHVSMFVIAVFSRFFLINRREEDRQFAKFNYRRNDISGPKDDYQKKMKKIHYEWVMKYHDE
jgi:hypothetical protein